MKKIYIGIAALIVSNSFTVFANANFRPLDEDRRKDVVEFIRFVEKKQPDVVAAYKDDIFAAYDFCSAKPFTRASTDDRATIVEKLEDMIEEFNREMPPQKEIADMFFKIKLFTFGLVGPKLTHTDEIRQNVFRYLTEVHAAVVDQDDSMCMDLLANFFDPTGNMTVQQVASRR